MAFERKQIEITLPDCGETLTIRRVNSSEAILILGYLPDFYSQGKSASETTTPKTIQAMAGWAVAGIIKQGSKTLVAKQPDECIENEFSFYEMTEQDQSFLYMAVVTGDKPLANFKSSQTGIEPKE